VLPLPPPPPPPPPPLLLLLPRSWEARNGDRQVVSGAGEVDEALPEVSPAPVAGAVPGGVLRQRSQRGLRPPAALQVVVATRE
jgi:hypothetical protein